MRTRLITLAAVGTMLLPALAPASALAQAEQYTDPLLGRDAGQDSGDRKPNAEAPQSVTAQVPATPPPATTEANPAQTDTETEQQPPPEETTTEEDPNAADPEEVPNQYQDPLAGQDGQQQGESQQQSTDTATPTGSTVSAASGQLASTGFALGLVALAGSILFGGGIALRRYLSVSPRSD